jgi:hypothetical protein
VSSDRKRIQYYFGKKKQNLCLLFSVVPCFKTNGGLKGQSYFFILQDAHANYLWSDSKGTGSLPLAFEVLEKATMQNLIAPGDFSSLKQMGDSNPIIKNLML